VHQGETHNSPSALDPYGGAITGIVGVNRRRAGTGMGAKPIFNTNVLCFGMPDTDPASLPPGSSTRGRSARRPQGIVDGGNQSGIPTAAGAFLFDESYSGKPLVFCGTGGIMRPRSAERLHGKRK
jgi:phosphoribosylformylglycinamidine synthase